MTWFGIADESERCEGHCRQCRAYSDLQEKEFAAKAEGYLATEHQAFVGTGYFDQVAMVITGGTASTLATQGSTEYSLKMIEIA